MDKTISNLDLERAFDERFDPEIKKALRGSRVAIAGLGGLGSNIAVMLTRSGIGHLRLIDFDTVDVTNLNRQMYSIKHIGQPKTEALLSILKDINPYLSYEVINTKIVPDNVTELFKDYSIVCEALDKPDQKAMLVREVLTRCPKATVISGNGMAGYNDANEIRTSKKMSRLYICGDEVTDVGNGTGLMAPRVAVCAGHQANKVIELILSDIKK